MPGSRNPINTVHFVNQLDMNNFSALRADTLSYKKWFRFSGKVWTALWKVTIVVIRSKLLSFLLAEFLSFFTGLQQENSAIFSECHERNVQVSRARGALFIDVRFCSCIRVLKNRLKANVSQLSQQPNKACSHCLLVSPLVCCWVTIAWMRLTKLTDTTCFFLRK